MFQRLDDEPRLSHASFSAEEQRGPFPLLRLAKVREDFFNLSAATNKPRCMRFEGKAVSRLAGFNRRRRLDLPCDDLFVEFNRCPIRFGIDLSAQGFCAKPVLTEGLMSRARNSIQPHKFAVCVFVGRGAGNKFFEALNALRVLIARQVKPRKLCEKFLMKQA
jgi:hypothetical protein